MSLTRRSFLAMGFSAGLVVARSRSTNAQAARPTSVDMQRADELLRQMTAKTEVSVGSSSSDSKSTATFTVTGKTRVGRGEERAFLSIAGVS